MEENIDKTNEVNVEAKPKNPSVKSKIVVTSIVLSNLLLIGFVFLLIQVITLDKKLTTMSEENTKMTYNFNEANNAIKSLQDLLISNLETISLIPNGDVDLTMSGMQDIGDGFYCSIILSPG